MAAYLWILKYTLSRRSSDIVKRQDEKEGATEEEEEEAGVECSDGVDNLRFNDLRHYCPRCHVGGSSSEAQFASVCRFSPPPSFAGSSESDVYRSSFTPAYQPIAFLHTRIVIIVLAHSRPSDTPPFCHAKLLNRRRAKVFGKLMPFSWHKLYNILTREKMIEKFQKYMFDGLRSKIDISHRKAKIHCFFDPAVY